MALIKCKDCGKQVSSKADKCPHCGVKIKTGIGWFGAIMIWVGIFLVYGLFQTGNENQAPKTEAELRKDKIETAFSPWDGSHYQLERQIKEAMNDPKSYEHDKTTYSDHGDYLIINTTFYGKNAFGGTILNEIRAKVDLNGNVTEIIYQKP